MVSLGTPLEKVPKISRKVIPALKRLGIKTVRDLLFYFPARYEDFSRVKTIREIRPNEVVTVQGKIVKITNRRTARKRMFLTEASINDGTGILKALWFNQPFMARNLRAGGAVNLSGKVALGPDGVYLQNPAYEKTQNSKSIHTAGLISIYPETRGITSRWLRYLIHQFIELRQGIQDPLPRETLHKYQLPETREAISAIHFPNTLDEAEKARRRFGFEELLLIQLRALRERLKLKQYQAPEIKLDLPLVKAFVRSLPYELTDAQRRSMWEIFQDLAKSRPMNRLLEGDVGSGKTVVAAAASLLTVKAGYKVVFMAPTEILARQHLRTLSLALAPFGVKTGLLIGADKDVSPETEVAVGTHALIQDTVRFENLGLVVVDEQHRFGVNQRMALVRGQTQTSESWTGAALPHFLSMSATPIPRTLALTIYGDLDLSILDEMPKARKPIITRIVEPAKRQEAYDFIREEVKKGRQVFVICSRIEVSLPAGSETSIRAETKAVKEEYKKLSESIFPDLRVAMLHGKLKSREKDAVMKKFKNQEVDILVSTSVVEVGVDIPNASVMMIEGAERFGLAQLHQFRGRVGRGTEQSYCLLFPTEDGMVTKRLRAVVEAKNGFELAEKDLEIRGPGDIFGTRQWGVSSEVMRSLSDARLVRAVRNEAILIIKTDPSLKSYPLLLARLKEMESAVHLE